MKKIRLDQALVQRGLTASRSQAENYIKLGYVQLNGKAITKPGLMVDNTSQIRLILKEQYVSRAAIKLASVANRLELDFKGKVVLDVGSSTGGFTDYALRHGAKKVIAVDVGANQLHPTLRGHKRIELHERMDIRRLKNLSQVPDVVMVDVSFVSLREILPHIAQLISAETSIIALLKPQFEAGKQAVNKGVVKNDRIRRQIIKDFEFWVRDLFAIYNKADSEIAGTYGNQERFYLLKPISKT